jgi:hypothetical protein
MTDRWARLGRCVTAAVVAAGSLAIAAGPADAARTGDNPAAAGEDGRALGLVAQQFVVGPDAPLALTVSLPSGFDPTDLDSDWSVVVTSHVPIVDRAVFDDARAGSLPRPVDSLRLSLDPATAVTPVDLSVPGQLSLTVPTETADDTAVALQLPSTGVVTLLVDLRNGTRSAASLSTFVARVGADGPDRADVLPVGVVMQQVTPPIIGLDGNVSSSDETLDELAALATGLTAFAGDAAAVAVLVDPSSVRAAADARPDLATTLLPALAASDLLANPRLPLDPSSVARAQRPDAYVGLLREGEDLLTELLPSAAVDRSVDVVDAAISTDGALLQRNLGTRLMVMPYRLYEPLPGSLRGFTDTTQLVGADLGDGSTVPIAVVDADLAAQLTSTEHPLVSAIDITAELLVIAAQIDRNGGITARHGLVLGRDDLGVIDPALLAHLAPLLGSTPGLALTSLGDLSASIDRLLLDGRPVVVSLPADAGPDLTERFALADAIAGDTVESASMVAGDDTRVAAWVTVVQALPSTAIDDRQADTMVEQLRTQFQELRDCVVAPDPYSFTLTGRSSVIPITLTNRCSTPITVRLQLDSAKIDFPDGDSTVELAPAADTPVRVRAEARSNGKSSVFLRVFTPAQPGSQVVPEVVLTARVNSLAGVGQLLLGAGVLVVMAWWLRHWRAARRRAQADEVAPRHPAARPAPGPQ